MTEKQSSPFSSSTSFFTLLLVICLVTISSSGPVKRQVVSNNNTRPLHLDDIGVYFETVFEGIIFPPTNLSLEVRNQHFLRLLIIFNFLPIQLNETKYNLVCSLFGVYSRLKQTLENLSEGDMRIHNVSVLIFVAQRQTKTLCERVRHRYDVSNLNTNISF